MKIWGWILFALGFVLIFVGGFIGSFVGGFIGSEFGVGRIANFTALISGTGFMVSGAVFVGTGAIGDQLSNAKTVGTDDMELVETHLGVKIYKGKGKFWVEGEAANSLVNAKSLAWSISKKNQS